jgi:hypothetical protein
MSTILSDGAMLRQCVGIFTISNPKRYVTHNLFAMSAHPQEVLAGKYGLVGASL